MTEENQVLKQSDIEATAQRMLTRYGSKEAIKWVDLHATSYDLHEFGYRFWSAVRTQLVTLAKEVPCNTKT